jgi:YgiT-type zinc finger domain-containing protein
MKCRVCASHLQPMRTDLPFKISERTIVIVKDLPVFQCERCSEYSMDDATFARVVKTLSR